MGPPKAQRWSSPPTTAFPAAAAALAVFPAALDRVVAGATAVGVAPTRAWICCRSEVISATMFTPSMKTAELMLELKLYVGTWVGTGRTGLQVEGGTDG